MQFINFKNEETYHVFRWIVDNGNQVTPEGLIAQAFQQAEATDNEQMPDDDICNVVRDKLIAILEDKLEDIFAEVLGENDRMGEVNGWAHSLWRPLLVLARERIDLGVVAEVLLIRAGKWNPSKEPPEIT